MPRSHAYVLGVLIASLIEATALAPHAVTSAIGPSRMHTHRLQRTAVIRLCWVDDRQQRCSSGCCNRHIPADRLKCREGPSQTSRRLKSLNSCLVHSREPIKHRGTLRVCGSQWRSRNGHAMSSAGPMAKFRWTIRKEPRWKNIARQPQAALLHMRDWQVLGHLGTDVDVRLYRVRAQPYPRAPHAESDVIFQWKLTRHVSKGTHPDVLAALGSLADCWLVPSIRRYGEWEVKDRLCAERCPDTFMCPSRGLLKTSWTEMQLRIDHRRC